MKNATFTFTAEFTLANSVCDRLFKSFGVMPDDIVICTVQDFVNACYRVKPEYLQATVEDFALMVFEKTFGNLRSTR